MVTAVTNLGRSGLSDWLIQRFTAVILTLYTFVFVWFFVTTPQVGYAEWAALFSHTWMRIFTLLALLSIAAHGWIGLWCTLTDYLTTRMVGSSALFFRIVILTIYALVTFAYIIWGVEILWGLR